MSIVPIRGLFEAHLTVSDLDRSIAFYRDVLGLPLAHRIPARNVAFFWVPASDKAMLGLWSIGTSPLRLRLHIAFDVALAQVFESVAALRRAGITPRSGDGAPIEEPIVLSWMPAASVYFDDPDGHSLEFICMLDEVATPRAGAGFVVGMEAHMSAEIRVERRDGWRKLVLNRPDKLNAVNEAMLHALIAALHEAEAERDCRALLLTGEGRGFCAGQELGPSVMPGPDGAARSRRGGRPAPCSSCGGCARCRCRWCAR